MVEPGAGPGALPCPECPEQRLQEYLNSPAGLLISQVIDLDFALQAGLQVTLQEVSYPEFLLLRYLSDERAAYEIERIKNRSDNGR